MTRMRSVFVASIFAAAACHRTSAVASETAAPTSRDEWEETARGEPACAAAAIAPDSLWAIVPLQDPPGAIRLPRSLRESDSGEPRKRAWIAPDSTELLLWASTAPVDAVASTGGLMARLQSPSYRLEQTCRLDVEGHLAIVEEFRHVDARGADTVFGIIANVLVRRGLAVGALGLTPSRAMRDSIFGAVAGLRLQAGAP